MQFPLEMMHDRVWLDRLAYVEAEVIGHSSKLLTVEIESDKSTTTTSTVNNTSPLVDEINMIRNNITTSLSGMKTSISNDPQVSKLEEENKSLRKLIDDLSKQVSALTLRVGKLEGEDTRASSSAVQKEEKKIENEDDDDDDDDDDFDVFGGDSD